MPTEEQLERWANEGGAEKIQQQQFNHWAIVEVFGHNRFAGRVSEETVGGCSFVRVDIPKTDGGPAFTKLFGQGAI